MCVILNFFLIYVMCRRTRLLMFILRKLCECVRFLQNKDTTISVFIRRLPTFFCNFAQNYAYCTNKAKGISYFVREFTYNDE